MRYRPSGVATLMIGSLLGSHDLSAQDTQTVSITVAEGTTASSLNIVPDTIEVVERRVNVGVTCPSGLDCQQLAAEIQLEDGSTSSPIDNVRAADATTASFFFPRANVLSGGGARFLALTIGDRTGRVRLRRPAPAEPAVQAETLALADLITAEECQTEQQRRAAVRRVGNRYHDNLARFLVDPLGNVLARPPRPIDEDDRVQVWVHGAEPLLSKLHVTRSSEFGLPGRISVLGAGVDITVASDILRRQAEGLPLDCATKPFDLADFAPGRGQVEISVLTALGERTSVGEFDFGVNTLYSGAISLGLVYSELGDPTFGLVARGQDSVITQTTDPSGGEAIEPDGERFMWGLFYHAFVPNRRDVAKQRFALSPVLGVGFDDLAENFFVGGSVDWFGNAYFTFGAHLGRVTDLDEESGLALGDVFDGPRSAIPTVEEWQVEVFFAVSIDVRAALSFLRVAASGAGDG